MKRGDLLLSRERFCITDSSGYQNVIDNIEAGSFLILLWSPEKCDEISLIKVMSREGKMGWCWSRNVQII